MSHKTLKLKARKQRHVMFPHIISYQTYYKPSISFTGSACLCFVFHLQALAHDHRQMSFSFLFCKYFIKMLQMSSVYVGEAVPCNSRAPRLEVSNTSRNMQGRKPESCGILATTRHIILFCI